MSAQKLAVVLLRGRIGLHRDVKRTLDLLKLRKKHTCIVVEDTPVLRGMLQKAKDAITWGAIDEETYKLLVEKRGKKDAEGKLKEYFSLNPPRGGFERKGIKTAYTLGGALGNRKEAMSDLVKKML